MSKQALADCLGVELHSVESVLHDDPKAVTEQSIQQLLDETKQVLGLVPAAPAMSVASVDDAQSGRTRITGLLLTFAVVLTAWYLWADNTVETEVPLGVLGEGGVSVVGDALETPTAYYPLLRSAAMDKGVPLVLVTMRSGDRAICDVRQDACVPTSREARQITKAGGGQ